MPTLLLSDDSAAVQRLIAMAFSDRDVQVVAVADGEEAIARITELRPDIVLAGIGTSRRSGYDVAAHVKSTPELAATPVLLLAAAFEPVDQVRAAQVRCDGVLVKPLDVHQLVSRVTELLRPDARAGSPPASALQPHLVTAPATPSGSGTVADYFDRLDAALARRAPVRPSPPSDDVGTVPTVDSVLQAVVSAPAPAASGEPDKARPTVEAAAPVVTDALVDELTRRVGDRLGTAAVRDVVREVVAETAERLIREEIARIRDQA